MTNDNMNGSASEAETEASKSIKRMMMHKHNGDNGSTTSSQVRSKADSWMEQRVYVEAAPDLVEEEIPPKTEMTPEQLEKSLRIQQKMAKKSQQSSSKDRSKSSETPPPSKYVPAPKVVSSIASSTNLETTASAIRVNHSSLASSTNVETTNSALMVGSQMTKEQHEQSLRIEEKIAKRQREKQQKLLQQQQQPQQQQQQQPNGKVTKVIVAPGATAYQPLSSLPPLEEIEVPKSQPQEDADTIMHDDGLTVYSEDWDFDVKDQLPPGILANGEKIDEEDDDEDEWDDHNLEQAKPESDVGATVANTSSNRFGLPLVLHDDGSGPSKKQKYCWMAVFFVLFLLLVVGIIYFVIALTSGAAASSQNFEVPRLVIPTMEPTPLEINATAVGTLSPTTLLDIIDSPTVTGGEISTDPTLLPRDSPTASPTAKPTHSPTKVSVPTISPTMTSAPTSDLDAFVFSTFTDGDEFYLIQQVNDNTDSSAATLVFDLELQTGERVQIVQLNSLDVYRQHIADSSATTATWVATLNQNIPAPLLQRTVMTEDSFLFWHELIINNIPQYPRATVVIPPEDRADSGKEALQRFDDITAPLKQEQGIAAMAYFQIGYPTDAAPEQLRLEYIPSFSAFGQLLTQSDYQMGSQHRQAAVVGTDSVTYRAVPQGVVTNFYFESR